MTVLNRLPNYPAGLVPCYYCGILLRKRKTWDHLVPRHAGGVDLPANLVVACRGPESLRGTPQLFDGRCI